MSAQINTVRTSQGGGFRFFRNLRIGTKIGGGYLVMGLLLIVCGIAGFYGLSRLSQSLDYISGPAWNTGEGGMETSIQVQSQVIEAAHIAMGVDALEGNQAIEGAKAEARDAAGRMVTAGVVDAESLAELEQRLTDYEDKLDDYENAIRAYRQVVEEFPGTAKAAEAQINIGNIYFYRLYDYVGGWPEFRKINAENYPGMTDSVEQAEDLLRETNRIRQEISKHSTIIRRWDRVKAEQAAESHIAIARLLSQMKNYPRALEAYRLLIERFPLELKHVAEARYSIAEIYQEQDRYLEAVNAYNKFVNLHPTHFKRHQAIYNMAICYKSNQRARD